jgi:hypothetical protein
MPVTQSGPLVTIDELLAYMGDLRVTESQKTAGKKILMGVQNEAERYCNRPLQPVHVREVLSADWCGFLNPSVTPVHRVIKLGRSTTEGIEDLTLTAIVKEDMTALAGAEGDLRTIDKTETAVQEYGAAANGLGTFGPGRYVIEYIGGYLGYYDEGLKQQIMRIAAREFERQSDDALTIRQNGDAEQAEQADKREKGWTEDEYKQLDRIRRRVIAR